MVVFKLSEIKRSYERQVYSLVALLSDVGGFRDIILVFPTWIVGWFADKMYNAKVYSQIPKKKERKDSSPSPILQKFV